MSLVIPSTLYLHSCTIIVGLLAETTSISPIINYYAHFFLYLPFANSFLKIGLFFTQTHIFNWSAGMCYKLKSKIGVTFEFVLTGYIGYTWRMWSSTIA